LPVDSVDEPLAYRIRKQNGQFTIYVSSGRTIMLCNDEASACHYVALLNEAYHAGYKLGYREGSRKSVR